MKKQRKLLVVVLLAILILFQAGCTKKVEESNAEKIIVAATLDPHSRILEFAKDILKEDYGYELEIMVLDDYYVFNKALADGEIDANYFQHVPFFEGEVEKNKYDIVNVAAIHIEPFGFYSKTINNIDQLPDGAKIIISNSVADHGRILSILENKNIITLDPNVDKVNAVVSDIVENPKHLEFAEIKPELLVRSYEENEGDLVAINGNYAIQAGINPISDSVLLEEASADNPYTNIVACRADNQDSEKIKALVEVLQSEAVQAFINQTYTDGSVIPAK